MVSAGSAPIVITDNDTVTVDVNISEALINKVAVGDSVNVYVSTVSDEAKVGKIKTVTGVVDGTGTYPVKIEIDNADGTLKPGMTTSVKFVDSSNSNTFVVDRNTVLENETEKYVYVLDGADKVKKSVVETGIDNGEYIELVSGVSAGDKVVVSGQDYLSDGEQVNVVEASKEE
jgi:RND family efflux transporter MFP subunit